MPKSRSHLASGLNTARHQPTDGHRPTGWGQGLIDRVIFLNLPYLIVTLFLSCFCGVLVYARYTACDPSIIEKITSDDQLLPYFVMDVLGEWTPLPGIFVAGIFAASLSSVSSGVNALASVFYVDVIALAKEGIPDRTGAKIINLLGVIFGLSSIGLVAVTKQLGNVLEASQGINSAIGGPLLGVFTAGMLFPQINTTGCRQLGFPLRSVPKQTSTTTIGPVGLTHVSSVLVFLTIGQVGLAKAGAPFAVHSGRYSSFRDSILFRVHFAGALWGLFTALPVSCWINLGAIVAGSIDDGLPLAVDGCPEKFNATLPTPHDNGNVLWIYQLSSLWYTLVSFALVFLVAMPISLVTGSLDGSQLDPRLIRHPADIFLWWMDEERRERWRFDVGENFVMEAILLYRWSLDVGRPMSRSLDPGAAGRLAPYLSSTEEGEVFEPRKSVSSISGIRMSTSGSTARKPSFTDMEMKRRQSSVFMAAYTPSNASDGAITNATGQQSQIVQQNGSVEAHRRTSRRSTRFSTSSTRSRSRKPSFADAEMIRRQSTVFMTQYMPPTEVRLTTSPDTPTTVATITGNVGPRQDTHNGALTNSRRTGGYQLPNGDAAPGEQPNGEAGNDLDRHSEKF
ncbi:sodium-coupled monocarboxylate transporter 1-like [Tropilaelaps mercedesae]|uniref:Sodium-coupled monocarboxylate transporter 1-like n=1 Tax=Tropilaelaps mercedesae TaxID=418985 RepID=A0A1V9X2C0_9ACAR|nr:sodium-coupled monocarboxylate transporter 1-like [Tropilaelaps mercedesae]